MEHRSYNLLRATSLSQGFVFSAGTNIPAAPPLNVYTDRAAVGPGPFHDRVRVE